MGLTLLLVYALWLWGMAYRPRGGAGDSAAFFINKRSSGAWEVASSIVMSCVGASATLGMAGLAFKVGLPAFWWLGAGVIGLMTLSVCLARKVRDSRAYTMPQMVETFLGRSSRPLISVIIVVAWLAILAAQFTALVKIISALTPLSGLYGLAAAFLLIVGHTLGGQAAVMKTDRLQTMLVLGGLALLLGWLSGYNPGWPKEVSFELINQDFPWPRFFYYLFIVGGNYLVCPMLFGRLLSARDSVTARRGGLMAALGLAACALLIVALGLACRGLIPADTPPDSVLTMALATVAPGWLSLLVLLALTGAIVSSADSCLITAGTVLSHDLLKRRNPADCRLVLVGLGLVGALISLMDKSILGFLFMAYDIYVGGVVAPVFIVLMAYPKRLILPGYAHAAIIVGGLCGLAAALTELSLATYLGLGLSSALAGLGLRPLNQAPEHCAFVRPQAQ